MSARRLFGAALLAAVLVGGAPLTSDGGDAFAQVPLHNCDFCHNLHGGAYAALTDYAVTEDLCLACHSDAGPATVDRDGVQVAVPRQEGIHNGAKHSTPTSCWDCHDHEGESDGTTNNLAMIPKIRTTLNTGDRAVEFTALSGTNSYADGDATYDGVCEVCHTTTTDHRFDGSVGGHQAGANCGTCHDHDGGFAGAGGGCAGCHSSTQGSRRAVVSEFDRKSHHVDWALAGYAAADSIPDSDCESCHDQAQHQGGTVRLKNADDATVTTYTGVPGELESFCAACHDADGAGLAGGIPFSDGLTPPDVATTWSASSHEGMGTTCADCHDEGHGSLKVSLLAPATVAATAPAYAEEEEGFCFSCHDSDGPATSDIESAFSGAINWVTMATGANSNTNLNDRHDVQYSAQSVSGAVIECVSCHDPHGDSSSQPYILDPDTSDGHVVGTNWYFSAYQTAGDVLSEFCLDCHDGSYAAGVSDQTTPIVNIETAWSLDRMGTASGGSSLVAGTGWVDGDVLRCSTCHNPHPTTNPNTLIPTGDLFSVVDTLYSKDGSTALDIPSSGGYDYSILTLGNRVMETSGTYWCATCHTREMSSNKACFQSGCHGHALKEF